MKVAIVAAFALVGAVAITWMVTRPDDDPNRDGGGSEIVTRADPSTQGATGQDTETPTEAGGDDHSDTEKPTGEQAKAIITVAKAFVAAATDKTKNREKALSKVATPYLVDMMKTTAPQNIPSVTPSGDPVVESASGYNAQARATFTDGTAWRLTMLPGLDGEWVVSQWEPLDPEEMTESPATATG